MVVKDITDILKREYKLTKEYEINLKEKEFLWASPIRKMIITSLFLKGELTKTDIYDLLKKTGLGIAYKNVSANLDQLERLGLINYKKGKRYNITLVSINTKKLFEYQDRLILKEKEMQKNTFERMKNRMEEISEGISNLIKK